MRNGWHFSAVLACCAINILAFAQATLAGGGSGTSAALERAPAEPSRGSHWTEEILWTESWEGQPEALFIPSRILRKTPLEDLPVSEGERQKLSRYLEGYEEYKQMAWDLKEIELPDCFDALHGHALPHEPTTLARKIVDYSTFDFTGEVVAVVTGWSTAVGRVVEAVYVQIGSILHDPEQHLSEGEVLAFFQFAGEMTIGSRTLCTQPNPDSLLARKGDQLLVAGGLHPFDDRLIHAGLRLRIKDGIVEPHSRDDLLTTESMSLPMLDQRIAVRRREVP